MATGKTYNSVDSKEQLTLVQTGKGKFGGYKQDLLVNSLSEMEIEFYVCTQCKGVMNSACQVGEEQIPNCENCVENKESILPMLKARQKIPELKANCPLTTRGCQWNATLSEVEIHLDVCQEFVVNCDYACGVILRRCELNNHCSNECLSREVSCEHCLNKTVYRDLKRHYEACLEFPLLCVNSCGANLRRKQTDSHIETDCPNTVVRCPHERFGCKEVVKRCEMEEHNKTKESKHLEMTTLFAVAKIEHSEERITKLLKEVKKLTDKLEQSEETITKLLENRLTDKLQRFDIAQLAQRIEYLEVWKQSPIIDSLTYPVVLRDRISQSDYIRMTSSAFGILFGNFARFEITWRDINLILIFDISTRETIPVCINIVSMSPLAKWPFEGRFKLTIIDRENTKNSHIYESAVVRLQPKPEAGFKLKEKHPNEFKIATIPRDLLLEDRFRTEKGEIEFTLQIQEAEHIRLQIQSQSRLIVGTKMPKPALRLTD